MESGSSFLGSPSGGPLQVTTADRVNQQRDAKYGFDIDTENVRESSVHEKISQFNTMSLSMQSKQLERKTADAALKRAMLGREEAESELRKHKEEMRALRKGLEDGKERERRVGERLETVMENYGRAKETHAHTQALWEKEIRRARKETFKSQSSTVKLQEEIKTARGEIKSLEEGLHREKERCQMREQEAFTARYQIVGVQEKLDEANERTKVIQQERDAFKTAAKNEEIARIAAEGRIPLPSSHPDDEFASPNKKRKVDHTSVRVSLSTMDVTSSMATEMEIDDLNIQIQWERQRAQRAQEMVEFLTAECETNCCPCSKSKRRASMMLEHSRRESLQLPQETAVEPVQAVEVVEAVEEVMEILDALEAVEAADTTETVVDRLSALSSPTINQSPPEVVQTISSLLPPQSKKEPRRSTIFCPQEGTFRTVSEQEAVDLGVHGQVTVEAVSPPPAPQSEQRPRRMFARTPSVDPPAFALLAQERTSLLSLLNAPHETTRLATLSRVPTVDYVDLKSENLDEETCDEDARDDQEPDLNASTSSYTVTTTVPIKDESIRSEGSMGERLRTPSGGSNASFDTTNPALTPTMTREEALAKIRERRGRAKSAAQGGTVSSQQRAAEAASRRDVSAPTSRAGHRSRP